MSGTWFQGIGQKRIQFNNESGQNDWCSVYLLGISKLVSISECISKCTCLYNLKLGLRDGLPLERLRGKDSASTIERKEWKGMGNRNIRNNNAVSWRAWKTEHCNQRTDFVYE